MPGTTKNTHFLELIQLSHGKRAKGYILNVCIDLIKKYIPQIWDKSNLFRIGARDELMGGDSIQ